jgi:hypothetical protein
MDKQEDTILVGEIDDVRYQTRARKLGEEEFLSPYDARVGEIESNLNRLRSQMEPLAREFREAATRFLSDWYFQQMEEMRQANSGVVMALGKDRIHLLKAELNELVKQVPTRVEAEFCQRKYWTHRKEWLENPAQEEMHYVIDQGQPGGAFATGMRKLLGEFGNVPEKYGFSLNDSDKDSWGRKSLTQRHEYSGRLDWPVTLLNPLRQYHSLCQQYVSAYLDLLKAKHDKEVASANDLWDAS